MQDLKNLLTALIKFKTEHVTVTKDCVIPFHGAINQQLAALGLTVVQTTKTGENRSVTLVTTLYHVNGGSISSDYPVLTDNPVAQGLERRNSFLKILGIAAVVDDNWTSGNNGDYKKPDNVTQMNQKPQAEPKSTPQAKMWPERHKDVIEKCMLAMHSCKSLDELDDKYKKSHAYVTKYGTDEDIKKIYRQKDMVKGMLIKPVVEANKDAIQEVKSYEGRKS